MSDCRYPSELEIKKTTDSTKSASYLDLFFEINQEGKLVPKINNKRDDFNFPIVNFQYLFLCFAVNAIFFVPVPGFSELKITVVT